MKTYLRSSIFFKDNFEKAPHYTLYIKRKVRLEFSVKLLVKGLEAELEISDERVVDGTYEVIVEKPKVNLKIYQRFSDARFGRCGRLKSFFGYKLHGALDPAAKVFPEWCFISGNHHDVTVLPNLNRKAPELRYVGDLGYKGATKYIE